MGGLSWIPSNIQGFPEFWLAVFTMAWYKLFYTQHFANITSYNVKDRSFRPRSTSTIGTKRIIPYNYSLVNNEFTENFKYRDVFVTKNRVTELWTLWIKTWPTNNEFHFPSAASFSKTNVDKRMTCWSWCRLSCSYPCKCQRLFCFHSDTSGTSSLFLNNARGLNYNVPCSSTTRSKPF